VFLHQLLVVHRLSSFLILLTVATHRTANERTTSPGQGQGRLHQLSTCHPPLVGLDLAHSQDPEGAGARAPSFSHDLGRGVQAQVQGNEDEHNRACILLQLFLLVLRSRWSFRCQGRAHGAKAQEGTPTMTVHVNRGVEPARGTDIVIGLPSRAHVVEAETLSFSLHPFQEYQDRPRRLRLRSLYLPQPPQSRWW